MCSIFGIPEKNIEVSKASNVTVSGIIMYLVHFVNRDDVNLDVHDVDIHDVKRLYQKNGKKINDAFKKHFRFKTNDFKVGWKRFADAEDEDKNEEIRADVLSAVKRAMSTFDMDFDALDTRRKFLTDYLLMEGDEIDDEEPRQSFIEQMEEEQKEEEESGNEGMDVHALPQHTNRQKSENNDALTPQGGYEYVASTSPGMDPEANVYAKKMSAKAELMKMRKD